MLFSSNKTPDYYLACRAMAGVQKISFHASGRWSQSYIDSKSLAPNVPVSESRHRTLWNAPAEFAPGYRYAYTIIVPTTDLRPSGEADPRRIILVTPDDVMTWIAFILVQVSPNPGADFEFGDDERLVGTLQLADGGTVIVLARGVDPTEGLGQQVRELRDNALATVPPEVLAASEPEHLRLALHGDYQGSQYWLDLAYNRPPVGLPICAHRFPLRADQLWK